MKVFGKGFEPMIIMLLPPGAFITLGFMLGAKNLIDKKIKQKKEQQGKY